MLNLKNKKPAELGIASAGLNLFGVTLAQPNTAADAQGA
jgi:hypothetical protein